MPAILLLIAILGAARVAADEVCNKGLDLTLLVDGSTSICNDTKPCPRWNAILDFCNSIVNALTIGIDDTRVAFATLSDSAELKWGLNEYTDKQSLSTAISNVNFPGGEFKDILSMTKLITGVYNILAGDRLDKKNVMILITDGAPIYGSKVYATVSLAIQADFVAAFVVCLKPGCPDECARGMSSPPKEENVTYFLVDENHSFETIRNDLVKQFCDYNMDLLKTIVNIPTNVLDLILSP